MKPLGTPIKRQVWARSLFIVFAVLLGAAGILAWQSDHVQEDVTVASQTQEDRAAQNNASTLIPAKIESQSEASYQLASGRPPISIQPDDPFKAFMEESKKKGFSPSTEQLGVKESLPQPSQDPFKHAMKEPASLAPPFAGFRGQTSKEK